MISLSTTKEVRVNNVLRLAAILLGAILVVGLTTDEANSSNVRFEVSSFSTPTTDPSDKWLLTTEGWLNLNDLHRYPEEPGRMPSLPIHPLVWSAALMLLVCAAVTWSSDEHDWHLFEQLFRGKK